MSRKLLLTAAVASLLISGPAFAQVGGGGVGGSAGGVGGSAGGVGGSGGVGSSPAGGVGGSTGTTSPLPSLGSGSTPSGSGVGSGGLSGSGIGSGQGAAGSGASTTEQRASEGATTINSLNVDSLAREGTAGTGLSSSSAGSFGVTGTTGTPSIAGAGPEALYNIPQPSVAVDPVAIRNALAAGSNATPKADGS
jgi:hypothetical protein